MRSRFAKFILFVCTPVLLTIYLPVVEQIIKANGLWFTLPLLAVIVIGYITSMQWIEERLLPRHTVSEAVAEVDLPFPFVMSTDWQLALNASRGSISEAIASAKNVVGNRFGVYSREGGELTATWTKKGWEVSIHPRHEDVCKVAVSPQSKWAGREVRRERWSAIFKSWPKGKLNDVAALDAALNFLGIEEETTDLAWCIVRFGD